MIGHNKTPNWQARIHGGKMEGGHELIIIVIILKQTEKERDLTQKIWLCFIDIKVGSTNFLLRINRYLSNEVFSAIYLYIYIAGLHFHYFLSLSCLFSFQFSQTPPKFLVWKISFPRWKPSCQRIFRLIFQE